MEEKIQNPIAFTYELEVSSTNTSQLKDNLGNFIENQDKSPNTVFHFLLIHKNGNQNSRAEYLLVMRPKPSGNSPRKEYLQRVDVGKDQRLLENIEMPILKMVKSKPMLSLSNVKTPETVSVFGTLILKH